MTNGVTIVLDLLCDAPSGASGGAVRSLQKERGLSAVQIPGARLVMRDYFEKTLQAELLGERGVASETVRVANLIPFIVLKAFAYEERAEEKDAYDLIFSLNNHGPERAAAEFSQGLKSWGDDARYLHRARGIIEHRFVGDGVTSFKLDGPTSYARFLRELGDEDKFARDRQTAAAVCAAFLRGLPAVEVAVAGRPADAAGQTLLEETSLVGARRALGPQCGVVIVSRPLETVDVPLVGLEELASDTYAGYLAGRGSSRYRIGHLEDSTQPVRTRSHLECIQAHGDRVNYWSLSRSGELVVAVAPLAEGVGVESGLSRVDLRLDNLAEAVIAYSRYLEVLYRLLERRTGRTLAGCRIAVSVENAVGLVPATHHGRLLANLGVAVAPTSLPLEREEVWRNPVQDSRGLVTVMVEELVYLCVGSGARGDDFMEKFDHRLDELYGRLQA